MPTSTNLGLVTPASSDYVASGATAMTTLANGIDAYWGALTNYTPTLTNVSTGTVFGKYVRMGKLGYLMIFLTAGTATAAGNITATLPSGWTAISGASQPVPASNAKVAWAYIASAGTTVTITADAAGTAFTLGAGLGSVRVQGWVSLA